MGVYEIGKNRYEFAVEKCRFVPKELRSVVAGASRTARLCLMGEADFGREHKDVGTGVLGPLTTLYMHYALKTAKERGIRRLYFLARDGLIMKRVADLLIEKWHLNFDTRYLYCSRESLLLPAFRHCGDFEYEWITFGYLSSISLSEICGRLNLSIDEIKGFFRKQMQRAVQNPKSPMSHEEKNELRKALEKAEVCDAINQKNRKIYDETVSYLEQEGMLDDVPMGIVDSGWRASSQYALNSIISKSGQNKAPIEGFYIGLNSDHWLSSNEPAHAFLFDWSKKARDYRLYNFLCFEMLLAAPHGRTIGYEMKEGISYPVISAPPSAMRLKLIEFHHRCALTFADYYSKVLAFREYHPSFDRLCRKLASLFISAPTKEEAFAYGDLMMAGEMTERDEQVIAPPITLMDMLRIAAGKDRVRGFWPQASLARTGSFFGGQIYRCFLDLKLQDIYRKYILKC